MRSRKGKGEQVALLNLGGDEFFDGIVTPFSQWAILQSTGEDYADCMWPITIKVKQGVTVAQLRQALMEVVMSFNEWDSCRKIYNPEMEPAQQGIKFFSIKEPPYPERSETQVANRSDGGTLGLIPTSHFSEIEKEEIR